MALTDIGYRLRDRLAVAGFETTAAELEKEIRANHGALRQETKKDGTCGCGHPICGNRICDYMFRLCYESKEEDA